jgi:hypothetical protein
MKFQCVSCGAPRQDGADKFSACEYCGGLPEVSLSHDAGLLNYSVKQSIRTRLEGLEKGDANAEASLIVLYLLDDLAQMADMRAETCLMKDPTNPQFLLLSAVAKLKERGVHKTKISVIDDVIAKLNMALSLDSGALTQEIKTIIDIIGERFYKKNGIKPSQRFLVLRDNLSGIAPPQNSILLEILN